MNEVTSGCGSKAAGFEIFKSQIQWGGVLQGRTPMLRVNVYM